jgi:hypothetical protein
VVNLRHERAPPSARTQKIINYVWAEGSGVRKDKGDDTINRP